MRLRPLLLLLSLAFALRGRATDLTVGYISRLPEVDYVWNSSNPKVEGWPAVGQAVTWRANVRSWLDRDVTIDYVWKLDGRRVAAGSALVRANTYSGTDLERPWTFDRHRLSVEIDGANAVAEQSETNNSLEVFTDSLSVGIWIEQSLYDYFRAHQHELGIGATSAVWVET